VLTPWHLKEDPRRASEGSSSRFWKW
jgi:hypothetical protein